MPRRILRSKLCFLLICGLTWQTCSSDAHADTIRYKPVSREIVEKRLERYAGSNPQRETTLKQMFTEAGCDESHLSEQPVKGSKLPNVICVLPGTSDRVIIVGAHFDRVPDGDGVVDNWSGASLLPSLYEAVKLEPRKHTTSLWDSRTRRRAKSDPIFMRGK